MRKFLTLGLVLVFMLGLVGFAACGGNDEVELVFGWWGNPTRNEHTTAVLELFMAEHDGIHVEEFQAGWGDYWGFLRTMAAGGDLPDIIQMDWSTLAEFTDNELLLPLNQFVNNGLNLSDLPAGVVAAGTVRGNIYAIPAGMNVTAMVYNRTLLDELGLSAPRNMTLDQFIQLSRDIYAQSGVRTNWGFNDAANEMEIHLRAAGVVMLESNRMGGSVQDYVEFFALIEQGINEGWLIRAEDMAGREGMDQDPLVYGAEPHLRAWNSPVWSNMITGLQNAAPEGVTLGMTTYPSRNPAQTNFGRASMFFSITTQSENVDEAVQLLDFWINSMEAHQIMMAERGVFPNTRIYNALSPQLGPMPALQAEFVNWMNSPGNSQPVNPPRPEGGAQVIAELQRLHEVVALGQMSPQDAAQTFFDFGNSVLN